MRVRHHKMNARQTFVLRVQTAKRIDRKAIARRKNPKDAAKGAASRPADGFAVL